MYRFTKIIFLLTLINHIVSAQPKTIDIPGVRSPDDIKVDRMNNGSYVAAYTANGTSSVAFYDENFILQKKIDLQYAWGKAGHFVFTSDGDVICIGFPRSTDETSETDFNFYVFKTNGEQLATKIFTNIQVKSLTMKSGLIFMTTFSKRDNALWYHLFDAKLNAQAEKSFDLDKRTYIDDVKAAFVTSSEVLLAYSFTSVDNGTFTHNIKIAGFKTSDGAQFINLRREMDNADYTFNYIGKQSDGNLVVIGCYTLSSALSGGVLQNSGAFRIVINGAGEKQSYITKSFRNLLPESSEKSDGLFIGSLVGNKNLATDFVWPHDDGFSFLIHMYTRRFLVITDSLLNRVEGQSLRENDNDKNEFVDEEALCGPGVAAPTTLVIISDSREGFPAVFATTLDSKHPEFKEWLRLDGENGNPQLKWTNDNNVHVDKHYDLKNCDPSLVPSDPSHLVLLEDNNKEVKGARILIYSVK